MMAKVLVTGASGFVGKPLCRALLRAGFEVRGAARNTDALDPLVEAYKIEEIGPDTDWRQALDGMDHVIHLAGKVHDLRHDTAENGKDYFEINALGTKKLAQDAVKKGIKRFIFLSSIKAMTGAAAAKEPLNERSGFHPEDAYGRSKLEAEKELANAARGSAMEWVIFRIPLVYGPHVKANMLRLLDLVDKAFLLPLGMVRNKRSLLYIGNLVDVLINALSHPRAGREIMLVSDGLDLSTPDLVCMIARSMGKRIFLVPVPVFLLRLGGSLAALFGKKDMPSALQRLTGSLAIDNAHVKRALDWEPPCPVEQGIQEMVDWYKGRRG